MVSAAPPVLTAEEIAEQNELMAHSCDTARCSSAQTQRHDSARQYLATIAAKDQEIAELRTDFAHLRSQAGPDSCADYVSRNDALQVRLEHAQRCREAEVADLMRQRDALESKLREAEDRYDAAINFVVQACLDSRKPLQPLQAPWLRDELLTRFDGSMGITQRLSSTAALQDAKEPQAAQSADCPRCGCAEHYERCRNDGCTASPLQDAKDK